MSRLFQTKCPVLIVLVLGYACLLLTGCTGQSYTSPQGYNLNTPDNRFELGKVLNEISGLSYIKDNRLLAISDSKEKVIEINVYKKKLKDFTGKIAAKGDYEDIVWLDSTIYVLESNGTIKAAKAGAQDSAATQIYPFWSKDKNDFETLYYDPSANGLIMLCKTCAGDNNTEVHTAYRFDLIKHQFDEKAYYSIDDKAIKELAKDADAKFKPSAAAISPVDKKLYILSSAGQLLVVADPKGDVEEVYKLNPKLFPQAEGIAFSTRGDMYISNEGKYGAPTLLIFPYQKQDLQQNE